MWIKKISDKRKAYLEWYSEIDAFTEIRNERPHICDYCWWYIDEMKAECFPHVVNKAISKKHRTNKNNILMACWFEHHKKLDEIFNWERYYLLRQLDNWYTIDDIKKEFLLR